MNNAELLRTLTELAHEFGTPDYVKGGGADLRVTQVDHEQLRLAVRLEPPVKTLPFLALRSMYVAEDNADTAELRVTGEHGRKLPAVGFGQVRGTAFRFGRSVVSRHNTSAPDLRFSDFRAAGSAARPVY